MQSIISSIKQIGLLTIALTIALAGNLAYGQWVNPSAVPPGDNPALPINTSVISQIKVGNLGINEIIAASKVRSDQYCDFDGNNCNSPGGGAAGAVTWFAGTTAPSGWLVANGQSVSRTTYAALFSAIGTTFGSGDGSTTFNIPDLRGEFVRGADLGRGVDPGRTLGSFQNDMFESHSHSLPDGGGNDGANGIESGWRSGTLASGWTGGSETRPRNIALLPIIQY